MPKVPHAHVRNALWAIQQEPDGLYSHEQVQRAILLDIREELRKLNRVFECPNFLRIPHALQEIRKNTTKKRRKKAAKKSA